jgi:hypothetical protein
MVLGIGKKKKRIAAAMRTIWNLKIQNSLDPIPGYSSNCQSLK